MARPNFQPQPSAQDRETWRNFLRVRDSVTGIDTRTSSLESTVAALQAAVAVLQNTGGATAAVDGDTDSLPTVAVYSGEATITFGAAPGTDVAEATVTAPWALSTSSILAWVPGNRGTSDNNAYEHWLAPITVKATSIVPGSSFTLMAYADQRLTGQFVVHWQGM